MLKELLEKLEKMAAERIRPKVFRVAGEPNRHYHLALADGTILHKVAEPPLRCVELLKIDDLIALANHHFDSRVVEAGRQAIFYRPNRIELVWDTQAGYETAFVNLHFSLEHVFMAERRRDPIMTPAELVYACRHTLRHAVPDDKLAERVGKLAFRDVDRASTENTQGNESMGRSVNKAVEQPDELPKSVQRFSIRPFSNPDLPARFGLDCSLEPEMDHRQWHFQPINDSWIAFNEDMLELIGGKLSDGVHDGAARIFSGAYFQQENRMQGSDAGQHPF